jgi:hypothetical protein
MGRCADAGACRDRAFTEPIPRALETPKGRSPLHSSISDRATAFSSYTAPGGWRVERDHEEGRE